MKAKEYAAEIKRRLQEGEPVETVLAWLGAEFLRETGGLAKARNCQTGAAVLGVLETQHQKWQALSRLIPGLKEDGYLIILESEAPLLYFDIWRSGKLGKGLGDELRRAMRR